MHAQKNKIVSCVKTIYYKIQRIEDKVVCGNAACGKAENTSSQRPENHGAGQKIIGGAIEGAPERRTVVGAP
jgi:hypothetical protein